MAIGKAQKQLKSKWSQIRPKLSTKMSSKEFREELEAKEVSETEKFNLRVYNHELLMGSKMTKSDWLEWLDTHDEFL